MHNVKTATGRPQQRIPFLPRVGLAVILALTLLEAITRGLASGLESWPGGPVLLGLLSPVLSRYQAVRTWITAHPIATASVTIAVGACLLVAVRYWLLFWHNQVVARLSGTFFSPAVQGFPMRGFDLLREIGRRPKGHYFVGLSPHRGLIGYRWRPVYISQRQRTMHRHIVGKTGSGKTQSVLWPAVLQDALDGKGVLVMDAKGSDENIKTMKAIAGLAGRADRLKIFALPAWNQPQLFSHTYNMVYVRPRRPGDPGGDPVATAERVFAILPLGDNEYYNTQAHIMFTNLCKLLHGMVDDAGVGMPFTMRDIAVCLKGVGNTGGWAQALKHCLEHSLDRDAALEIESQVTRHGHDVHKCFSGIVGAIDKFLSPLVNAYDPDIVFEDVLQNDGMVYVQLPANLFKLQAPAMGKVMLMDVQQEGSLRQVFRGSRNQRPFSVTVDEFYNFADLSIVDSLNKLRDANLEYTLAHQSIADLELVSKEFAVAVWDNTRTKDILNQDNPELCEKLAKSIGTHQEVQKTVRMQQGALFTSLTTGDASSKLVEAYRLHPNAIKNLARCGQGYLYNDEGLRPVAYGMLPALGADFALARRDQVGARGLRLYETFIAVEGASCPPGLQRAQP
jgi:type IV secretory pathway TraG/TraD family ATPase VirD4